MQFNINNKNLSAISQQQLSELFAVSVEFINKGLEGLLNSLQGALLVIEQNASSDYHHSIDSNSIKILIQDSLLLKERYVSQLNHIFNNFTESGWNDEVIKFLRLNLSEQETEKHGLDLLDNLVEKCQVNFRKKINEVLHKFEQFTNGEKLTLKQMPLSPLVISRILFTVLSYWDISLNVKKIIYNSFNLNILQQMGSLYEKVGKFEVDHSNQNSKISIVRNSKPPSKIEINDLKFKRLLDFYKLKNYSESENDYLTHEITTKSFELLFTKLPDEKKQGYYSSNEIINAVVKISQKLNSETINKKLHPKVFTGLKITEFLFQSIVKGSGLPQSLKPILSSIEKSVYLAVGSGSQVFSDTDNSLRKILNSFSRIPDEFSSTDKYILKYVKKLEELEEKINQQYEFSDQFYNDLFEEYQDFLTRQMKKNRLIQKRVKEKEQGREHILRIKKKAAVILDKKMIGRYMPEFIRNLLIEQWHNVLTLDMLRNSEDSNSLQSKVQFVDFLLNLSNPQKPGTAEEISKIVEIYSEGLMLVAFNPNEVKSKGQELFDTLVSFHGLTKKKKVGVPFNIVRHVQQIQNSALVEDFQNNKEATADSYYLKAKSLKTGDWLEFIEKNNKNRVKISWISPISGNILFVNENGIRVADKSIDEVAQGFKNNTCIELKTQPIIDKVYAELIKRDLSSIRTTLKT